MTARAISIRGFAFGQSLKISRINSWHRAQNVHKHLFICCIVRKDFELYNELLYCIIYIYIVCINVYFVLLYTHKNIIFVNC